MLELYPSEEQRGLAGRFIAEAREKRRSGAGVLAPEDQWMLESLSLPGGINLPRLRWARKNEQDPKTAAHLAVAFDTFESRLISEEGPETQPSRPLHAFGLLSYFDRSYSSLPWPCWRSAVPIGTDGEKHPSDRSHTDRLLRLQRTMSDAVLRNLGLQSGRPVLRTEISVEKAQSLRELHRLCDWVITLDRNAGIEYFDSPKDNREIYDGYLIDCVPEREDLGCLQLITSTSNLDEVRGLLDSALDQMGLSRSRRNAEFLLESLKGLSAVDWPFALPVRNRRLLSLLPWRCPMPIACFNVAQQTAGFHLKLGSSSLLTMYVTCCHRCTLKMITHRRRRRTRGNQGRT